MEKVLKIIPYFGNLPSMWLFYIASLKRNKFLHILFITDIEIRDDLPENMHIVKMSLKDFFQIVENKIGLPVAGKNAYKICDLKPFWGCIFQEYIKEYRYWAYGDIDLIYGDLSRFLTKAFKEDADVISFREDWLSGPFTVIKNIEKLNSLPLQSPDIKKVLGNPKYMHFDECGAKYGKLRAGCSPVEVYGLGLKDDIMCWTTLVHKMANNNEIKLYLRHYIKESLPWGEIINYENGKIIGSGATEYPIYHFVTEKRCKKNYIPKWKKIPDYYYISPTGIYNNNTFKFYRLIAFFRSIKGFLFGLKKRVKDSYKYRVSDKLK